MSKGKRVPNIKSANTILKLLKMACILGEGKHCGLDFGDGTVEVDGAGNVYVTGMTVDEALRKTESKVNHRSCSRCGLKYRKRVDPSVCNECEVMDH